MVSLVVSLTAVAIRCRHVFRVSIWKIQQYMPLPEAREEIEYIDVWLDNSCIYGVRKIIPIKSGRQISKCKIPLEESVW